MSAVDWDDPRAAERYGRTDSGPGTAPSAADIAHFVVASDENGLPVGCGGLRQLDVVTGEMKRMYVAPSAREPTSLCFGKEL